jgi:hypothetical protein
MQTFIDYNTTCTANPYGSTTAARWYIKDND